MNGPRGPEGGAVSKVEKALNEEPSVATREAFPKPGTWASELLRVALAGYEDRKRTSYVRSVSLRNEKLITASEAAEFKKWKSLRQLILNQGNPDKPWEYTDFSPSPEVMAKVEKLYLPALDPELRDAYIAGRRHKVGHPVIDALPLLTVEEYNLPPALLSWAGSARRIFSIDKQMEDVLTNLDYSKATWNDVLMPLSTFVIELPTPLPLGQLESGATIDTFVEAAIVMNARIDDKPMIWIVPLLTETPGVAREGFSKAVREMLEEGGKGEKQLARALAAMNMVGVRAKQKSSNPSQSINGSYFNTTYGYLRSIDLDEPIENPEVSETVNTLRKLVAGTCTYLSARAGTTGKGNGAELTPLPSEARGITDPDEVLLVDGATMLGDGREGIQALQKELKRRKSPIPHKRRAHKRTLPNGKVIDIEEMEVGGNLPKGELYQGGATKID